MPASNPSPPGPATGTTSGLLTWLAQTIGGVKTFLSTLVASAGVQTASLFNTNGTNAADVMVKVGTSAAAGTVNVGAKSLSLRSGLNGGTEVEHAHFRAVDGAFFGSYIFLPADGAGWLNLGLCRQFGTGSGNILYNYNGAANVIGLNTSTGLISQSGTDSTGSPGAATINKPIGKSAIAATASSVVITNSLVATTSHIIITPHARDATCKELIAVPAAGSFTVSGTAAATAALPFSWEVKGLL